MKRNFYLLCWGLLLAAPTANGAGTSTINTTNSYAWGANIGWINFESIGNPRVSLFTGTFSGYAYPANCGWIKPEACATFAPLAAGTSRPAFALLRLRVPTGRSEFPVALMKISASAAGNPPFSVVKDRSAPKSKAQHSPLVYHHWP